MTKDFHQGDDAAPQVESLPYLGGISRGTDFGERLWIEVDGLYRPLHAESLCQSPDGSISRFPFTVLTWQFPVLAKYRPSEWKHAPFIEGGPSLRLSGNMNGYEPSWYGVTVGAGVETRMAGLRWAPGIRYTRWAKD